MTAGAGCLKMKKCFSNCFLDSIEGLRFPHQDQFNCHTVYYSAWEHVCVLWGGLIMGIPL